MELPVLKLINMTFVERRQTSHPSITGKGLDSTDTTSCDDDDDDELYSI